MDERERERLYGQKQPGGAPRETPPDKRPPVERPGDDAETQDDGTGMGSGGSKPPTDPPPPPPGP